jgi:hypothetical protein
VQQQTSAGGAAGTVAAVAVERVDSWVTYTPVLASGSAVTGVVSNQALSEVPITNMELYTNNIFVNPEINC